MNDLTENYNINLQLSFPNFGTKTANKEAKRQALKKIQHEIKSLDFLPIEVRRSLFRNRKFTDLIRVSKVAISKK